MSYPRMNKKFIQLPHLMKTAEFEFQTDRNYYVDLRQSFLALMLKFVKGRAYDTYESKEKEHKDDSCFH